MRRQRSRSGTAKRRIRRRASSQPVRSQISAADGRGRGRKRRSRDSLLPGIRRGGGKRQIRKTTRSAHDDESNINSIVKCNIRSLDRIASTPQVFKFNEEFGRFITGGWAFSARSSRALFITFLHFSLIFPDFSAAAIFEYRGTMNQQGAAYFCMNAKRFWNLVQK